MFEIFTELHHSQTNKRGYYVATTFETFTELHYSQTK